MTATMCGLDHQLVEARLLHDATKVALGEAESARAAAQHEWESALRSIATLEAQLRAFESTRTWRLRSLLLRVKVLRLLAARTGHGSPIRTNGT